MRIGKSRADRLGFIVFLSLAALLGALLATTGGDGGSSTATGVATQGFASLPSADAAVADDPEPAATTAPIPMPTATATPVPLPTATSTPEPEPEPADAGDDEGDGETASANAAAQSSGQGQSAGQGQAAAAPANPQAQATQVPNPQPQATEVPNPQPKTTEVPNPQAGPATAPPPNAQGGTFTYTLTATVSQPSLHTSPGGPTFTPQFKGTYLPPVNPTVFGNPLVYRVIAGTPDDNNPWAQVYVPGYPNGATAWVNEAQFSYGQSNRMLQINISTNTVTVFEGSNVLLTTGAVTGKSSTRTPVAQAWVEERLDGSGPNQGFIRPGGPYGTFALSLGIFSNDLNSFGGSIPKIAIHGTNNPGLIGQYASNGCIRVRTEIIHQIAQLLPVGSKVILTT